MEKYCGKCAYPNRAKASLVLWYHSTSRSLSERARRALANCRRASRAGGPHPREPVEVEAEAARGPSDGAKLCSHPRKRVGIAPMHRTEKVIVGHAEKREASARRRAQLAIQVERVDRVARQRPQCDRTAILKPAAQRALRPCD